MSDSNAHNNPRMVLGLFEHETIDGDGLCPVYLHRWTLLKAFGCALYLHKFVGDDWAGDLHDHPKRFISIGLWGRYTEHRADGSTREYRAPWVRTFPAEHRHRISGPTVRRPCWTLVIVLRAVRPWGFWVDGRWVPWRDYVGSERAEQRKICP